MHYSITLSGLYFVCSYKAKWFTLRRHGFKMGRLDSLIRKSYLDLSLAGKTQRELCSEVLERMKGQV
jgi:hypothetical protein